LDPKNDPGKHPQKEPSNAPKGLRVLDLAFFLPNPKIPPFVVFVAFVVKNLWPLFPFSPAWFLD